VNVTVVWATSGAQDVVPVTLPPGANVAEAVARSGIIEHYALDAEHIQFAVFGRRVVAEATLIDGDRVEITRALRVDPRETRRRRALATTRQKSGPGAKNRTR
jgi:uncharacterized protein